MHDHYASHYLVLKDLIQGVDASSTVIALYIYAVVLKI